MVKIEDCNIFQISQKLLLIDIPNLITTEKVFCPEVNNVTINIAMLSHDHKYLNFCVKVIENWNIFLATLCMSYEQ